MFSKAALVAVLLALAATPAPADAKRALRTAETDGGVPGETAGVDAPVEEETPVEEPAGPVEYDEVDTEYDVAGDDGADPVDGEPVEYDEEEEDVDGDGEPVEYDEEDVAVDDGSDPADGEPVEYDEEDTVVDDGGDPAGGVPDEEVEEVDTFEPDVPATAVPLDDDSVPAPVDDGAPTGSYGAYGEDDVNGAYGYGEDDVAGYGYGDEKGAYGYGAKPTHSDPIPGDEADLEDEPVKTFA